MKLSTKVEYGLIAVMDIAFYSQGNEVVPVVQIADRQGISKNYLEQILTPLRTAQIITASKGAQGGYMLTAPPNEISLASVLNALDSTLLAPTVSKLEKGDFQMAAALKNLVWDKLDASFLTCTERLTVADLLDEYNSLTCASNMFYI